MGSPVVLIGLIVLSKRMMKALCFCPLAIMVMMMMIMILMLLSQMMMRTYSSTHAHGPELCRCARHISIDLSTFPGSKLPKKVEKSMLMYWWLCQVVQPQAPEIDLSTCLDGTWPRIVMKYMPMCLWLCHAHNHRLILIVVYTVLGSSTPRKVRHLCGCACGYASCV